MDHVESVIIGGGQAGLATSYYLTRAARDHLVLEQASRPAPVWRNERWDSFTLVTPNWTFRIPGAEYQGDAPDGFMPTGEVVACFERYVERYQLPLECNRRVTSVEPAGEHRYLVRAEDHVIEADNVVVATGLFQRPKLPPAASLLSSDLTQLHSSAYRNPEALPAGAVLVVGSAQSGCQIAEELYQRGREVFLCTGGAGRAPRRYRGKDIIWWLQQVGFFDLTPEELPPGMGKFAGIPHVSGARGGHTLNLHQFARDGVTLLGRLRDAAGHKVFLAPDLHQNLASADGFEENVLQVIDRFIEATGLEAPEEELPRLRHGFAQPVRQELDLEAAGVSTVIWAIGYVFDYSFIQLPVRDADGFPVQAGGVTRYPGLYFVGQPWMPSEKTGLILGVGEAARSIAAAIVGRPAQA